MPNPQKPTQFMRQLYLVDNNNIGDSIDDYAAEIGYRVKSDLMSMYRRYPQIWGVDILMDNSHESTQITHKLISCVHKVNSLDKLTDYNTLEGWYNTIERKTRTLIVVADVLALNKMGNQMLRLLRLHEHGKPDIDLFDKNNNLYINASAYNYEKIPKYSGNEQKNRFMKQQNIVNFE